MIPKIHIRQAALTSKPRASGDDPVNAIMDYATHE